MKITWPCINAIEVEELLKVNLLGLNGLKNSLLCSDRETTCELSCRFCIHTKCPGTLTFSAGWCSPSLARNAAGRHSGMMKPMEVLEH